MGTLGWARDSMIQARDLLCRLAEFALRLAKLRDIRARVRRCCLLLGCAISCECRRLISLSL